MDNQIAGHDYAGPFYLITSIVSTIIGWVSIHNVQEVLQIFATLTAIGASGMAMRHYYLQSKKQKS